MKVSLTILVLLLTTCTHSFGRPSTLNKSIECDTFYIPVDLDDCIIQLNKIIPDSTKAGIIALTEEDFSARTHLNLGMWIRNNWGLWSGSRLAKFFTLKGIYHPDDMSGIILDSYYRYLIGQDIKLEEQIRYYHEYWERVKREEIGRKKEELSAYHIADTVLFNYRDGFSSKAQESKYDNDLCIAKGIITDIDNAKYTIKVKLLDACGKKGIVYYDSDGILIFDKNARKTRKPQKRTRIYMKAGEENWFEYSDWETNHYQ